VGRGEEHADYRGKHDQRHHARLSKRIESAHPLRKAGSQCLSRHSEGRKPRKAKKFITTRVAISSAAPALCAAASGSGRPKRTLDTPSANCARTTSASAPDRRGSTRRARAAVTKTIVSATSA